MSYTCPVSGQRIDSTIVRMISFEVAGVVLLLLLTHHILFASLLLFDFTARLFRKKECSPFLLAARILQKRLSFPVRMSDEAPKRFALYLGWSMAVLMMIFAMIDNAAAVNLFASVLLACSLMEAAFEFCVGCVLYRHLSRWEVLRR